MSFARRLAVLATALALGCGSGSPGGTDASVNYPPDAQAAPQPVTTAVGTPTGPTVTKSIDATGGTLASADGRFTLTVPANAVNTATSFSIQPITSLAPTSIGSSYRLEPHDVTFAAPIQLTSSVPEAGVSRSSISMVGLAYQDSSGHWNWVAGQTRDSTANTVSVTTTHFSDWSTVEGYQITPMVATVKEGSSLMIEVVECVEHQALQGDLPGLACDCHLGDPKDAVKASQWSVNGVPLGNATLGTLDPNSNGQEAIYKAPAQKPSPNTVTVSARLTSEGYLPQWLAFSHISIGTPGTYQGTFAVTQTGLYSFTAKGTATVSPHVFKDGQLDDGIDMTDFDVSGSMRIDDGSVTMGGAPCTADVPTQTLQSDVLKLKKEPLSMFWSLAASWAIHCTVGQTVVPSTIIFSWMTGCPDGTPTNAGSYLPDIDPNRLVGDFTQACTEGGTSIEVEWDFKQ